MTETERHIVIAGGSKRLGLYLATQLTQHHVRLSILYRTLSEELSQLQSRFPDRIQLYPFHLEQAEDLSHLGKKIFQDNGAISELVTVASQFYPTPLGTVSEKQWNDLFDTNVKGHFFFIQGAIPFLHKPSHIVTLVDIHSFKPLKSYSPYCAAKGALLTLSRNLAFELAPHTRVNSISPGFVLAPETFSLEEVEEKRKKCLLGRLGTPEDIYQGYQFLRRNHYITGYNLCIDGGNSLL